MAEFLDYELLHSNRDGLIPADYGYIAVQIYYEQDCNDVLIEKRNWIDKNINGKWTTWIFYDRPNENADFDYGRAFAFELEEDAMAFKLRWT